MTRIIRVSVMAALLFAAIILAGCGQSATPGQAELDAARKSFSEGLFLEAETGYERYLQLEPQGASRKEAWERLLEISVNIKGDLERSVALLEAMYLELGNDKIAAWETMYKLGELYEMLGNRQKAVESLEKGLILAVDMPERKVETHLRLAQVYRAQGSYDLLLETLEQCSKVSNDPGSRAKCLYELAQSFNLINNGVQSRQALEEIISMHGVPEEQHAMAVFLLADIYESEREVEKARELLESIRDTYPNPKVIETRLNNMRTP